MTDLIRRTSPHDIEVRGDGRTVHGIAVPFDEPTDINEHGRVYREVFRKGAFARTIQQAVHKVKLLALHDSVSRLPLGAAKALREDTAGLYFEARVSETRDGDEVLSLIRDGALEAFSIGFVPVQQRDGETRDGKRLVERTEVKLREVSIVPFPAFAGATIMGVRAPSPPRITQDEARRRLAQLSLRN